MIVKEISPPVARKFSLECSESELRLLDKVLGDTPFTDRSTQQMYNAIADAVRAFPRV